MCGYVNAKNSYGGYTGFTAFAATNQGKVVYLVLGDTEENSNLFIAVYRSCTAAREAELAKIMAEKEKGKN